MRNARVPKWGLTHIVEQVFATDVSGEGGERGQQPPRSRVSEWSGFPLRTLGESAMHAAIWNGSLRVMHFLLEQGQHPDARDKWRMTPLMVAIMRHALPLIRTVFRGRETIPYHLTMDVRTYRCLVQPTAQFSNLCIAINPRRTLS